MSEPQLIQLMSEEKFAALASSAKKLADLNSDDRFAQLMSQPNYAALASAAKAPQLVKLLGSSDFQALMLSSSYKQMAGSQAKQFAEVIGDRAVLAFMDAPKIQAVMGDRPWKFLRLFANPNAMAAISMAPKLVSELANDPKFVALMNDPTYRAALASHQAQMGEMLSNFKFREFLGSHNTSLMTLMDNPKLRAEMLSQQGLPAMMADRAFIQVMSQPKLREQFLDAMPKVAR
jgi:hypothetical protein